MQFRTITESGKLSHNTNMFRDRRVFRNLSVYLQERFESRLNTGQTVPVHVGACSQGEDLWSIMISIARDINLTLDQFTFVASDINKEVLTFAKAGLVKLATPTVKKINKELPELKFMDFFDQDHSHTYEYRDLLEASELQIDTRNKTANGQPIYKPAYEIDIPLGSVGKIKDDFLLRVKFKVVSFYRQHKTSFKEPCLVFFRHQLRHLIKLERERFASAMYRLLEPGSTIVVGSGDQAGRDVGYLTHKKDGSPLFERKYIPETKLGVIFEKN